MKNKVISVTLSAIFALSLIFTFSFFSMNASAATTKYNADAVVKSIANYVGKTGKQLGYVNSKGVLTPWCILLVSKVLSDNGIKTSAGVTSNIGAYMASLVNDGFGTYYSFSDTVLNKLRKAYKMSEDGSIKSNRINAKKGDILLMKTYESANGFNHVEIVTQDAKNTKSATSIGGNLGGGNGKVMKRTINTSQVVGIFRFEDKKVDPLAKVVMQHVTNPDTGQEYEPFYTDKGYNYAASYAQEKGGYLAIVNSGEENVFVYNVLRNAKIEDCYLGINYQNGTWSGVNGEMIFYKNFATGQKASGVMYAQMNATSSSSLWSMVGDNKTGAFYMIEWDKKPFISLL